MFARKLFVSKGGKTGCMIQFDLYSLVIIHIRSKVILIDRPQTFSENVCLHKSKFNPLIVQTPLSKYAQSEKNK